SRTLDWLLVIVGVVLVVSWVAGAGDTGMWALGLVCIAVGGLLLLADRFGGGGDGGSGSKDEDANGFEDED
ncbi:MAG: hypothetical protein ACRDHF_17450, partial [Tepidiformaceae bacterium]